MTPPIKALTLLLWALLLSACTIQLVPSYDQALVEGLDKTNTQALTLFAALEGPPDAKFDDYEDEYAEVIGSFEALHQRASNRQVPPLTKRLSKQKIVQKTCPGDPALCLNVTPSSLLEVLGSLRTLRDTHRKSGLASDSVELARDSYNPAIQQALFIENALKR